MRTTDPRRRRRALVAGACAFAALGVGCYATVGAEWRMVGRPWIQKNVITDARKVMSRFEYQLRHSVTSGRHPAVTITASCRKITRTWKGRTDVTWAQEQEHLIQEDANGKTRHKATKKRRVHEKSRSAVRYLPNPDSVESSEQRAGNVPLRVSSEPLLLAARGGNPGHRLLLRADDSGRAGFIVGGFPKGAGATPTEAADSNLEELAGDRVRGEARDHVRGRLRERAERTTYAVRLETAADARQSGPSEQHVNASETVRIDAYSTSQEALDDAAAEFVRNVVNAHIGPHTFNLQDIDTKTPVRGAVVSVEVAAPEPRDLLSMWFSDGVLTRMLDHVAPYDRGPRRETSSLGGIRVNTYAPGSKVSVSVRHAEYIPLSQEFALGPRGESRAVGLLNRRDYVEREINSRIAPLVLLIRDIDSRSAVRNASVRITVRSPGPETLLRRALPDEDLEPLLKQVRPYASGTRSVRAESGSLKTDVYTADARVSLEVRHPDYHVFRAEFAAAGGALRRNLWLTEKEQPDRSRIDGQEPGGTRKP